MTRSELTATTRIREDAALGSVADRDDETRFGMSAGSQADSTVGPVATATMRRIVAAACRAPSVHNTQPWRWHATENELELWADPERQLRISDPVGRNLTISCGAALHHAQVAASAMGFVVVVDRLPDPAQPNLMARLRLNQLRVPARRPEDLLAIEQRCTDRRRFTSWPVPDQRLEKLASRARHFGAAVEPVTDVGARIRIELLVNEAMRVQNRDAALIAEERAWIDHSRNDGIPRPVIPERVGSRGEHPSRFDSELREPADLDAHVLESSDGLIVIGTSDDGPLAWLHAGESLSALWLQATVEGLSVVPLSQVVEVEETRTALHADVLSGLGQPQLLIRIGWQEIGRSTLPRTPRRDLDDVLD